MAATTNDSKDFIKDAILLTIAGSALILEIVLLLHQMKVIRVPVFKMSRIEDGTAIGEVVEKKNNLRNRAQTSLTWYPLAQGDKVFLNDTLLTGTDSTARIR